MKRGLLCALVVGAGLAVTAGPAHAARPGDARNISEVTQHTGEGRTVIKSVRGGYVHAVGLVCPVAPCDLVIYDSTSSTPGTGTRKWEARVAVNNGAYSQDFPAPLVTDNGIAIEVDGASTTHAFVAYE